MRSSVAVKNKKQAETSRSVAMKMLHRVFQGRSLASEKKRADILESRERALCMELVHGVLRWRWKLEFVLNQLMKKPLRAKEQEIKIILLLALYELIELNTPDYAVVNETVQLTRGTGKSWATGLVNGVLRSFIRDSETCLEKVEADEVASTSHPQWLIDLLRTDWPECWREIAQTNNQRPPLWLRVNLTQTTLKKYRNQLDDQGIDSITHSFAGSALKLERGMNVVSLPGFEDGSFSVQDVGAQLAACLLDVHGGHRVLDLCAAPGGKTCHILECAPELKKLVAVELEASRMSSVKENLERLKLDAELVVADASEPSSWWGGETFDRILIDAPCSASGVIRRHPDIKSLRRQEDLSSLTKIQQKILQQAWSLLSPGGELLYVTCSVLRQENEAQLAKLLSEQHDAEEVEIDVSWGVLCLHGRQLLPGEEDSDGFYFARVRKVLS